MSFPNDKRATVKSGVPVAKKTALAHRVILPSRRIQSLRKCTQTPHASYETKQELSPALSITRGKSQVRRRLRLDCRSLIAWVSALRASFCQRSSAASRPFQPFAMATIAPEIGHSADDRVPVRTLAWCGHVHRSQVNWTLWQLAHRVRDQSNGNSYRSIAKISAIGSGLPCRDEATISAAIALNVIPLPP